MKYLLMMALLFGCAQTSTKKSSDMKEMVAHYTKNAKHLVERNQNKAGKEELRELSMRLIEDAKPIMAAFIKKNPECADMINFMMGQKEAMINLSLTEIERQYHDGEALPSAPDTCYEAKELMVHPATVAIISKQPVLSEELRTQVEDEIVEVIAHIELL